MLNKAVVA